MRAQQQGTAHASISLFAALQSVCWCSDHCVADRDVNRPPAGAAAANTEEGWAGAAAAALLLEEVLMAVMEEERRDGV